MSHEERTTEENINAQKLMRQKEEANALRKRREPAKVKSLSLMEDDAFRFKTHIIAAIALAVLYFKYRIAPSLGNEYGYQGKDVRRNQRLARLPIQYREQGEIEHEEELGH